jgi:hypothetical protein
MLIASAIGQPITRGVPRGLLAAAVAGVLVALAVPGASLLATLLLAGAAAAGAGTAVAILLVPRDVRSAFEAFSWLGRRELRRFTARTGAQAPRAPLEASGWLESTPRSPANATARIELLAMLGRFGDAQRELDLLAPPATDADRVEQAGLRAFVAFIATGDADQAELDELVATLDPGSGEGLEAAVSRATGEARATLDRGVGDWTAPLVAVRPRLGRDAFMGTFRDTWLRVTVASWVIGTLTGAAAWIILPG